MITNIKIDYGRGGNLTRKIQIAAEAIAPGELNDDRRTTLKGNRKAQELVEDSANVSRVFKEYLLRDVQRITGIANEFKQMEDRLVLMLNPIPGLSGGTIMTLPFLLPHSNGQSAPDSGGQSEVPKEGVVNTNPFVFSDRMMLNPYGRQVNPEYQRKFFQPKSSFRSFFPPFGFYQRYRYFSYFNPRKKVNPLIFREVPTSNIQNLLYKIPDGFVFATSGGGN